METLKLNLEIPASLIIPLADRIRAYSAVDRIFTGELLTAEDEETKPTPVRCPIEPGTRFKYHGMEFAALGMEQGGVLAVSTQVIEDIPFDEDNSNDWRKSSIRKRLGREIAESFDTADLLPFVSDLTADDGMKDYGTSTDTVFLLSCDLYRKYRAFIPKYDEWTWTLTPWTCIPSFAYGVRFVATDGSLNSGNANSAHAAAPACLFNPKSIESAAIGAGNMHFEL